MACNVKTVFLSGLILLTGAVTTATAQDTNQQTMSLSTNGWQTSCNAISRKAVQECRLQTSAVLTGKGQRLVDFSIQIPDENAQPVMMLRVPLEVSLNDGIAMQVDEGKLFSYSFQSCNNSGCYVGSPLDKDLLAAMIKGNNIAVSFKNTVKNDISLTLPLTGFGEAYESVK